MSLKAGSYRLDTNSGNLYVYTFKEGLLSKLAHDLLIDITNFKVNLDVPEAGFASGNLEIISVNSFEKRHEFYAYQEVGCHAFF